MRLARLGPGLDAVATSNFGGSISGTSSVSIFCTYVMCFFLVIGAEAEIWRWDGNWDSFLWELGYQYSVAEPTT
jgi:hypothetical protein